MIYTVYHSILRHISFPHWNDSYPGFFSSQEFPRVRTLLLEAGRWMVFHFRCGYGLESVLGKFPGLLVRIFGWRNVVRWLTESWESYYWLIGKFLYLKWFVILAEGAWIFIEKRVYLVKLEDLSLSFFNGLSWFIHHTHIDGPHHN